MRTRLKQILRVLHVISISVFLRDILREKQNRKGHFFSQFGEDKLYRKLFDLEKRGLYIDVGSWKPISGSNTYLLYKHNWKGIAIDPNFSNYLLFKIFRSRDVFLNSAVGNGQELNLYQFIPSNFCTTDYHTHLKYKEDQRLTYVGQKKLKSISLSDLSIKMQPHTPSLITIDCEGGELEVLKSNNWQKILPRVIIVEILPTNDSNSDMIFSYLNDVGYEFLEQLHVSYFFIHNSQSKLSV